MGLNLVLGTVLPKTGFGQPKTEPWLRHSDEKNMIALRTVMSIHDILQLNTKHLAQIVLHAKMMHQQQLFSTIHNYTLHSPSVRRQKGLTGYCFKYADRPFCLRTDNTISVTL